MRMIDADRFGEIMEQWKKDCLADNDTQHADIISDMILQLDDMPTFTQPNEPLTLEQLWEMDNIPIWVVDTTINRQEWCYWKDGLAYSCEAHPEYYDPDEYGLWLAYRRAPEEEV